MKKRQIAPYIVIDAKVRFGKPVIEGTRVPVALVVGKIAGGMTVDDLINEYDLTKKQVLAALKYAADVVNQEQISLS